MHVRSLVLSAAAASLAAAMSNTPTLSQLIASNDNLSEFGKLLKISGAYIEKAIAAAGMVTVFAPTNEAINTWLKTDIGQEDRYYSELSLDFLLEYHILPKVVYSSEISSTPIFASTLSGVGHGHYQTIEANLEDGDVVITSGLQAESKVLQADLNCTVGVVHVIDKVLTAPANVLYTGLIVGLDVFVGAVLKLGETDVNLEGDSALRTYFAPTNAAFDAIGSAASKLSTKELRDLIKYHVVPGVVYSTDLRDESVETLGGNKIQITVENGGAFVNAARIINADILIPEGVLHIIDSVLNPDNSTAKPDPSATTAAVQFSGASSANLAVLTSTLPQPSTTASLLSETMSLAGASSTGQSPSGTKSNSMSGPAPTRASPSASSSQSPATGGAVTIPTAPVAAMALVGGAALFGNW